MFCVVAKVVCTLLGPSSSISTTTFTTKWKLVENRPHGAITPDLLGLPRRTAVRISWLSVLSVGPCRPSMPPLLSYNIYLLPDYFSSHALRHPTTLQIGGNSLVTTKFPVVTTTQDPSYRSQSHSTTIAFHHHQPGTASTARHQLTKYESGDFWVPQFKIPICHPRNPILLVKGAIPPTSQVNTHTHAHTPQLRSLPGWLIYFLLITNTLLPPFVCCCPAVFVDVQNSRRPICSSQQFIFTIQYYRYLLHFGLNALLKPVHHNLAPSRTVLHSTTPLSKSVTVRCRKQMLQDRMGD